MYTSGVADFYRNSSHHLIVSRCMKNCILETALCIYYGNKEVEPELFAVINQK
jgi:hypothetical protein